MDTIDHRLESFIAWHGEVPPEARRLKDFEAHQHAAPWIRRNVGVGIVHSYVIGYVSGERWWTLFFERIDAVAPDGAQVWSIEAYCREGKSWSGRYLYWPEHARWRHCLYQDCGEDYGRFPSASLTPACTAPPDQSPGRRRTP